MNDLKLIRQIYKHSVNPCRDIPEVTESCNNFDAWAAGLDTENAGKAEDLCNIVKSSCELQGFIFGFQYAMQLASECRTIEKAFYKGG